MTRPLAVLRPEPGNAATAARIEALGLSAIRLPLFVVRPLAWQPPEASGFDALLLTSANAVRHAGAGLDRLRNLPVVAVGDATARAAMAAGLNVASVGTGSAADAVRGIAHSRLLQLAGREHVPVGATTIPVYAAETLPVADARALAGTVVLLHSVRAARRAAELVLRDGVEDVRVAAISEKVCAAGPPSMRPVYTDRPDDVLLIALAARLAAD